MVDGRTGRQLKTPCRKNIDMLQNITENVTFIAVF